MNFIEAAATGRRLRLKNTTNDFVTWQQLIGCSHRDFLTSREYEVEPETVTVTREQVATALNVVTVPAFLTDVAWNKLKELSK